MAEPSPQSGSSYLSQTLKVTNRARVIELLTRLKDGHSLVSITVGGENEPFNSAILAIDRENGHLLLDELTPRRGHDRLIEAGRLNAYARLRGIDVHFAAQLDQASMQDGIAVYRVPLPKAVHYAQKRSSFRVQVSLAMDLPVTLSREDGESVTGRLCDLSIGGTGALFPPDTLLAKGDRLADCLIDLPGAGRLSCPFEVRFAKHQEETNRVRIGGRFLDLTAVQERKIQRSVNFLQRELLRKRPKE
jgi:c-di-GMP-binding flagellar brake protein YcgR